MLFVMNVALPLLALMFALALIWVVFRTVKYFGNMNAERRRLRIEVSKLAHEVEGLREAKHAGAQAAEKTPV